MTLRDVLVFLDSADNVAGQYALGLSRSFDVTLTAIAPVVEPHLPAYVSAEISGDFLTKIHEDAENAARHILRDFSQLARSGPATLSLGFRLNHSQNVTTAARAAADRKLAASLS